VRALVKILLKRIFEGSPAGGERQGERRHWCPMWGKDSQDA
jgi:hypothetical protein